MFIEFKKRQISATYYLGIYTYLVILYFTKKMNEKRNFKTMVITVEWGQARSCNWEKAYRALSQEK